MSDLTALELFQENERLKKEKRDVAEDVWTLNAECNLRQMSIDAALAEHSEMGNGECSCCAGGMGHNEDWPCPTVKALRGEPTDGGSE